MRRRRRTNPADLINIALEKLVEAGLEIPRFSTLDTVASTVRGEVNEEILAGVRGRMTPGERRRLLGLPEVIGLDGKTLLFGQRGTVAHNDPVEQEKDVKFTSLLANLVIFHNTLDIADVVRQLQAEGHVIDPLDLALTSPYLTEHINRFGAYSTHELGITPEDYDTRLDVDFSVLEDDQVPAAA